MYLGQLVEKSESRELFAKPLHPYTKALISAIPSVDIDREKKRVEMTGEIVSPINPGPGCRFAPSCPYASDESHMPQQLEELLLGHFVACRKARVLNPAAVADK